MTRLHASPAKPRRASPTPRYPRALAALAVAATVSACCEGTPVALAGDVAPAFSPGTGASTTSPVPTPTVSASDPGPERLGGIAPTPYEPEKAP